MANYNKILILALFFALLLSFSMASNNFGFLGGKPGCEKVFGVRRGDTCSNIAQLFNLSTEVFDSNNPNLNCDALFVGQWLCVAD